MFTGVRAQVVLPIVGVLALFLSVLGFGLYQQLAQEIRASLDQSLRCQGEYVAFLLQSPDTSRDLTKLTPHILAHPDLPQSDKLVRILNPRGETLLQVGPAVYKRARGLMSFNETIRTQACVYENEVTGREDLRLVSVPVGISHQLNYVVQVAVPVTMVDTLVTRMRNWIVLGCFLCLLAATFGGWLITGKALKPVRAMATIAKTIGSSHVEERLPVPESHDELEELARTFNEMIERLDGTSQQIRRFTADASHELRTPLTIMKGELEVALRKSRSAEEWKQITQSVLDEVDHMSEIIEDLLSLARVDSGEFTLDLVPVDLDDIVRGVARYYWKIAEKCACTIEVDSAPGITIAGDIEKLGRLMRNLLDNAIKYSIDGGTITLTVGRTEESAFIAIRDQGTGIAQEELESIFKRFYRGQNACRTHRRGTGLGLSMCEWIVQAHGGRITVESEVGKGSVFTVWFPADVVTDEALSPC